MSGYDAPIADQQFVLEHIVGINELAKLPAFAEVGLEALPDVLSEAQRFVGEVIAPTNRDGDRQGSVLTDEGNVRTPDGFQEAYDQLIAGGWSAMSMDAEYGGGGFPWAVGIALTEMITAANMSFSLNPLLTQGAIHALVAHGSEDQKNTWLPKLISAEWSGTMNLTEPNAGSDVGALTTKAVKADDGTYRISGQKIYITWGDHDMAENIVHLVLARTEDGPPGTKGISLFIVPKYVLDADGNPGERNDITTVSLEHKMGIHASPTCVLQFGENDGAVGYLIGEENNGMRYMFTMMNQARLNVGLQGLALGDRAYQQALEFSQERLQGYRRDAEKGKQVPIIAHPDVRRMLMTMKAYIEALRCISYLNASSVDVSLHHPDEDERRAGQEMVDLLTPITKGFGTDLGNELTSLNIQIHGGMGFIEETGAAQHYRDIRIAAIYEGTNGIQAMDLVGRKLPMRDGGLIKDLLAQIAQVSTDLRSVDLGAMGDRLESAAADLMAASTWLLENGAGGTDDGLAGATPYLRLTGLTVGGWLIAKSAVAAKQLLAEGAGDAAFLEAKVETADFYCSQLLPQTAGLVPSITAGATGLYSIDPANLRS